jgi:hypothetical protein
MRIFHPASGDGSVYLCLSLVQVPSHPSQKEIGAIPETGGRVPGNLPLKNTAGENSVPIAPGPGKFFGANGTRPGLFRPAPVPAGKNPERSHPEARDMFRPPGMNPPGRVFRRGWGTRFPAVCGWWGRACGGWADGGADLSTGPVVNRRNQGH